MAKNVVIVEATIPVSGTNSDNVTIPTGSQLLGFFTPSALDGANFSFKGAVESDVAAVQVVPDNTLYSISVAASSYYPVELKHFTGLKFITVVSDATETAERIIKLVCGQI